MDELKIDPPCAGLFLCTPLFIKDTQLEYF